MSSFTCQRPTCKGLDTTLQKHPHHPSIAADRGQSKTVCSYSFRIIITQPREVVIIISLTTSSSNGKRRGLLRLIETKSPLASEIIISTYNVRSLYQLGKLNQLFCGRGGRSRSWNHWYRKASPYLIHSDERTGLMAMSGCSSKIPFSNAERMAWASSLTIGQKHLRFKTPLGPHHLCIFLRQPETRGYNSLSSKRVG